MRIVVLAIAVMCGGMRSARAEDKPWAAGVSAETQRQALALYREGNTFFEQAQYKEALVKYERALAVWDHPAIRYNAAVCLINLDRPVEAAENLERALAYGAAPLGAELHKQGVQYEKLLAGQLAELEVRCDEAGAWVTLDGQPLFTAPHRVTRRVLAGNHQIVATKSPSHQVETRAVVLAPREKQSVVLVLRPVEARRKLVRRWARWKPWAVLVGGIAIGGAGVGVGFLAARDYRRFDARVRDDWDDPAARPEIDAIEDRADRERLVSYGAIGLGALGAGAGILMIALNQPRLERSLQVVPALGPGQAGLAISGAW